MSKIKKSISVLAALTMMLCIFTGTVGALEKTKFKVYLSENGSEYERMETTGYTIGEFLAEYDIELYEGDYINYDLDLKLENYLLINIRRAVDLKLFIDGRLTFVPVRTAETTIAGFIKEYGELTGKTYQYDLTLAQTKPENGMLLHITSFFSKMVIQSEVIPFETIYETSNEVSEETVINEGANGTKLITYEVFYVGNKEASRTAVSEIIEKEQVKRLIYIPEKKAVSSFDVSELDYSKKLTMSATAYTLAPCCTGVPVTSKYYGFTASGMKAEVGVIAVDPKVIPLGTELYVEGYGFCIAGDTGGAVKGNIIDLFFDTLDECWSWGRRNVEVYILTKQ